MVLTNQTRQIRYEVNVCGGTFESVLSHFDAWKREPLIYRPAHRMFEGKATVRRLDDTTFADPETARRALQRACVPEDGFALAVFVQEDGRALWLVMAAYDDASAA